jgi:hypothetical protein
MDPTDFHTTMTREADRSVSSIPPQTEDVQWADRTYTPWKISSAASRQRAKNARKRSIRRWRQKKARTD